MIRDRLLERLGVPTEPELVERASRRERVKRNAWGIASLALAAGTVAIPWWTLEAITGLWTWLAGEPGVAGLVPLMAFIAPWIVTYLALWNWGVESWELVAPWQFREEWAREEEEVSEG